MVPIELLGSVINTTREGATASSVSRNSVYEPFIPGKLGETVIFTWRPFGVSTNTAESQPGMLFLRISGFRSDSNTIWRGALTFWLPVISINVSTSSICFYAHTAIYVTFIHNILYE